MIKTPGPLLVMDSHYPSAGGGGAESQCGTLGRWFNAHGMDCTLVVPMADASRRVAEEVVDGLPVQRIAYPRVRLLGGLVLHLRLLQRIWRLRRRSSMIHVHICSGLAVTACLAARLAGLPVLVKMTGATELIGGALDPRMGVRGRVIWLGLHLASGYHAISRQIADAIEAVGLPASRLHRIPNAVDVERFRVARDPAAREALCPGAEFVALYVGRLEAIKNLPVLLQAWASALARDDRAWLLLAGEGSERERLEALAQQLGIASRVRFLGNIDAIEDLAPVADIAVLPSLIEGLSNAMLECMACGLPMLASRVGGNPDFVIEGRTGWLHEATDAAGLASRLHAVRTAGDAQWRHLGEQARKEVCERASLGVVANAVLASCELPLAPLDAADPALPGTRR